MAKKKSNQQSTSSGEEHSNPQQNLDRVSPLVDALQQAMREYAVAPEVQEEALRTLAEASIGAAKVDAAQLDAIARSAEARAKVTTESLKLAATPEERQHILKEYMKADDRDAQERRGCAERSTDTQRGISTIAGKLLLGIAVIAGTTLLIGGTAYAGSKGWLNNVVK